MAQKLLGPRPLSYLYWRIMISKLSGSPNLSPPTKFMNSATAQQQGTRQNPPDGAGQVFLEQVRLLYSGVTYATAVTLTLGTVLVYAQREMASPPPLLAGPAT